MLQAVVVCPSPANRSPTGLPELLSRIIEPESPGRLKGSTSIAHNFDGVVESGNDWVRWGAIVYLYPVNARRGDHATGYTCCST